MKLNQTRSLMLLLALVFPCTGFAEQMPVFPPQDVIPLSQLRPFSGQLQKAVKSLVYESIVE